MKSNKILRLGVSLLFIALFGFVDFISFDSEQVTAQQSPAAMAIKQRIMGAGIANGSNQNPGPSAKQAPRKRQQVQTPPAKNEAKNLTRSEEGEDQTAPKANSERASLEIVTEPFLTYSHFTPTESDELDDLTATEKAQKAEEEAKKKGPVTAVAADTEGIMAFSAGKDASIQLWLTYDFSTEDNDYVEEDGYSDPFMMGNYSDDMEDGNGNMGRNRNGVRQNGDEMNSAGNLGMNRNQPGNRNPSGNMDGRTDRQRGDYSGGGYGGSFHSIRRGNLKVSDSANEDSSSEKKSGVKKPDPNDKDKGKAGTWARQQKKVEKRPSTLGKRRVLYELLDAMKKRRGSGFSDLLISPFQDFIYTADYDGNVRRWNIQTKKSQIFPYKRIKGVMNTMWGVAFLPLDNMGYPFDLVAGANNNGSIYFWNSYNRRSLGTVALKQGPVYDINFAPDGSAVVTAGSDGTARVVAIPDMEVVSLLKGHKGPILSAVFSESGQYVLTAGKDKSACLWDSFTGELIAAFIGHTGTVRKAIFLSDRFVLTCGDDKTARIWEIPENVMSSSSAPFGMNEFINGASGKSKNPGAAWGSSDDESLFDDEGEEIKSNETKTERESTTDVTAEEETDDQTSQGEESEITMDASGMTEEEVPEQSIADAKRGYEIARFEATSPVFCVAVNQLFLLTGCQDGKVRVWDIAPYIGNIGDDSTKEETATVEEDAKPKDLTKDSSEQNPPSPPSASEKVTLSVVFDIDEVTVTSEKNGKKNSFSFDKEGIELDQLQKKGLPESTINDLTSMDVNKDGIVTKKEYRPQSNEQN